MKKLNFLKTKNCILIFLILGLIHYNSFSYGQKRSGDSTFSHSKYSYLRTGDFLSANIFGTAAGSTRFLPIILTNGLERWTSPGTILMIDGIPFRNFPFNFNSVDLLPLDLIQIEAAETQNLNSIGTFHSSSIGSIDIILKPIPDSFRISIRGFTGSETGDPLFHVFTRPGYSTVNKNKLVPTGFFSVSGKSLGLSFRITSGYTGYYSTGSINDKIISNINRYHFGKQNKQVLAAAELGFDIDKQRQVKVFSSFISFYGWDLNPFLSSYVHTESYIHTIRASILELFTGFDLTLIKDGSIGDINEGTGILPARFSLDQYSILPFWSSKITNDLAIKISSDLNYFTASNINQKIGSLTQNFFPHNVKEWSFGITTAAQYQLTKSIDGKIYFRYENSFNDKDGLSLDLKVSKWLDVTNNISLKASSVLRFPNLTEINGNFSSFRIISPNVTDTFNIKGNRNLSYERNNCVSFSFEHSEMTFTIYGEAYLQKIYNPILQATLKSVRTEIPGDILRDAEFLNRKDRSLSGLNFSLTKSLDFFIVNSSYSYSNNTEAKHFPKHKLLLSGSLVLPFNAVFKVEWLHQDETFWEEFRVEGNNDFLFGSGFDAVVPEINRFNVSFEQSLSNLYFLRDIQFVMMIDNIFNNVIQYHPLGNQLDRAFIFSLSFKI